jgi:hypothetical protein
LPQTGLVYIFTFMTAGERKHPYCRTFEAYFKFFCAMGSLCAIPIYQIFLLWV